MGIYLDFNASTPVAPAVAARMAAVTARAVRESIKRPLGGDGRAGRSGDRTSTGCRTPRMCRWRRRSLAGPLRFE